MLYVSHKSTPAIPNSITNPNLWPPKPKGITPNERNLANKTVKKTAITKKIKTTDNI
jgi:hypothetical protein